MRNNGQIQRRTTYAIEVFSQKTYLVRRGLEDLSITKKLNPDWESTYFICQFCGRIIDWPYRACIFCGKCPYTKKEVITAWNLSNRSFDLKDLLKMSKIIKNGIDLELSTPRFREMIDSSLECEPKNSSDRDDRAFFQLVSYRKWAEAAKFTGVSCPVCGTLMTIAEYCFVHTDQTHDARMRLTKKENFITALNNILLFIEDSPDFVISDEDINKFISQSINMLAYNKNTNEEDSSRNYPWENPETSRNKLYSLDSRVVKEYLKVLLRKIGSFSNGVGVVQVKMCTAILGSRFFPVWSCCCGRYMAGRYRGIICDKCGCEVQQRDCVTDKEVLNFFTSNPSHRNFKVYNQMKIAGITGGWNFFGWFRLNPYDCNLDLRLASLVLNLSYLLNYE